MQKYSLGVSRTSKACFFVLIVTLIAGCSSKSPLYFPDDTIVPHVNKQGDMNIEGTINMGAPVKSYSASVLYALNDSDFVAARLSYQDHSNCYSCYTIKRRYSEVAYGQYQNVSLFKANHLVYGLGFGQSTTVSPSFGKSLFPWGPADILRADGDYVRLYSQANWSWMSGRWEKITTSKLAFLHASDYREYDEERQDVTPDGVNFSLYFEQSAGYIYHFKDFHIKAQMGLALPLVPQAKFRHDWVWGALTLGYKIY